MSGRKRRSSLPSPQTCKATRACGPISWRRGSLLEKFRLTLDGAQATRVTAGYLDKDKQVTLRGEMVTPCQRERVVRYIADLSEAFGLRNTTTLFAANYFDRWLTKLCVDKRAKQDRIDRSWTLHVDVVTGMMTRCINSADCVSHVMSFISKPVPTQAEAEQRITGMRRDIKLASVVCLLIAAKFSDVQTPSLSQLVDIHNDGHPTQDTSVREIHDLELEILGVLDWKLNVKTPHNYAEYLASFCDVKMEGVFKEAVESYMDMSVYCYELLEFHPAVVASACLLKAWQDDQVKEYKLNVLAKVCDTHVDCVHSALDMLSKHYAKVWRS